MYRVTQTMTGTKTDFATRAEMERHFAELIGRGARYSWTIIGPVAQNSHGQWVPV